MIDYHRLWQKLTPLYESGEAKSIIRMLLTEKYGLSFTDLLCGKCTNLSANTVDDISKSITRLMTGEPIQYLLGYEIFEGNRLKVGPGVLIPRPETAELCQLIIKENHLTSPQILDIGTGTACIPITLAKAIPQAEIEAWELSREAIPYAKENIKELAPSIKLTLTDTLDAPYQPHSRDIIVSNPPYICDQERKNMHKNVLHHEPHQALFVPDSNPLLFYDAITRYAAEALKPQGKIYFEINPLYAEDVQKILQEKGFVNIRTQKDFNEKTRFVHAQKRKDYK